MFNLMRLRWIFFSFSLCFLIPGLFFLFFSGLKPSIDFTGGSLWEIKLEQSGATADAVQQELADVYSIESIQAVNTNQFVIKGKEIDNDIKNQAASKLKEKFGGIEEFRFSTVGPALGQEALVKMITAVVIVAVIITLYVWKQFDELKYGVCAILAMFHDTFILLGSFAFLGWWMGVEVDLLFVTAVLTTLSFSVHDTIVVYDRIRELRKKHRRILYDAVVNIAVWETFSRSLNNSLTIIIMLLALTLLGGDSLRMFALALLIGAITGTYSSTFTAAPLLILWDELKLKIKKRPKY